jgi:hypothetical protein
MEKTIGSINEVVEATKKGLKNQLKGLFGFGKKKETAIPSSSSDLIPYVLGSIEERQRKLGDYLFFFGDYSEALNVYKNLSKDFLNDKSWRHYGSSCEVASICSFISEPHKRYIISLFCLLFCLF